MTYRNESWILMNLLVASDVCIELFSNLCVEPKLVNLPGFCDHGVMAAERLQRPSSLTASFYTQEIKATKGKMTCLSHVAYWWQSQKTNNFGLLI